MRQVPDRFIGRWVSELCASDVIEISYSSIIWKHFDDDAIDMLDPESLRKKYPGTYEINITDYAVCIIFNDVESDSLSHLSGFYQFVLDEEDKLHMHYLYELEDPEADPEKDSFWQECYVYVYVHS